MKEYTVRFFLDTQEIVEYKIFEKNIYLAECEAYTKFNDLYSDRDEVTILRVETTG